MTQTAITPKTDMSTKRFIVTGQTSKGPVFWAAGLPNYHWVTSRHCAADFDQNRAENIATNMAGKPVTWPKLAGEPVTNTKAVQQ